MHLLAADVDVVAELMEFRRKLALSAFELLEAETGGTLVENEMKEMGQASADGVDSPHQNGVVVLVRGAHESPSHMGEVNDRIAVGVIGRCGVKRERGARNVRDGLVVVRVDD